MKCISAHQELPTLYLADRRESQKQVMHYLDVSRCRTAEKILELLWNNKRRRLEPTGQ